MTPAHFFMCFPDSDQSHLPVWLEGCQHMPASGSLSLCFPTHWRNTVSFNFSMNTLVAGRCAPRTSFHGGGAKESCPAGSKVTQKKITSLQRSVKFDRTFQLLLWTPSEHTKLEGSFVSHSNSSRKCRGC